jgi:hypothetical protein
VGYLDGVRVGREDGLFKGITEDVEVGRVENGEKVGTFRGARDCTKLGRTVWLVDGKEEGDNVDDFDGVFEGVLVAVATGLVNGKVDLASTVEGALDGLVEGKLAVWLRGLFDGFIDALGISDGRLAAVGAIEDRTARLGSDVNIEESSIEHSSGALDASTGRLAQLPDAPPHHAGLNLTRYGITTGAQLT